LAKKYFDGSVVNTPMTLALRKVDANHDEVRHNTLRGFHYKLQSTTNLSVAFTDEPGGITLALEGWLVTTNSAAGSQKYYRAASSLIP
jgi:hypothetical protein